MEGDTVIVGVIGHVDHGKSSLVAALMAAARAARDLHVVYLHAPPIEVCCATEPTLEAVRELPRDRGRRWTVIEPKGNRKQRRAYRKQNR